MSFLANADFIPQKPFTLFYGDAIIEFYETIFLNKAGEACRVGARSRAGEPESGAGMGGSGEKPKKEGLVKRFISARREVAAERQAKQEKEAWETSRPEREAAERARRAWHIENNPAFETLSMRERRVMVNLWDERFPMPERIEKPAERERRIEEVSTKMNRDAFHSRELALDRPKREAMLERLISRQPEQQQERTRDLGPTKDYGPSLDR